ncbi:2-isopropylmalate synthase [Microbacterium azadirachtae]|uniref:2-isopropylmalate synthase n=1 Tax=Microbacterium azadirachtae TaxID=582680 RepID=UPI0008877AB4|nr:2-isopropylmalate synthase [Microbacterium azadirachtae]SDM04518.1 2-isopropylmalate synthase [Microbacterium azadirachtae]SEG30081.1 2-isopropylmalate synthase [Microbacterium azadirachtae]SEG32999.1 2-isopropylmalate synthase [Microbacterium azadirachtae]
MTRAPFPGISTPAGPVPAGAPAWNRQRHSQMPSHRYADPYDRVSIPLSAQERTWPTRRLTAAPLWVPVDLRDGNQALAEPMDPARKRRFFELMVAMGYKEIEVGYPSASQTDFDFVRLIAEQGIAPEDVTIVVFTAARRDLISRTVESIRDIRNPVVIHLYTATAPIWRETVLGRDRDELRALILDAGRDVLELAGGLPHVRFEFSPEVFMLTEPDYALEICNAMTALWEATPERPVILNLPATVEIATPNVYADQIEYMHRHLDRRESVILSVHPHNDRGTGIACAELAVLAGAQRVEGCLLGNGERTGNVDLVTLALNLHAQGIDPLIDFSDIDEIRRTVEHSNRIEVHPRHPYVGDLVHTAFSGTHQDAIRKGFAEHRERAAREGRSEREIAWRVPYLPVDPADLGRSYDAVIRVNSQSGKGGIAYLLETEFGIRLPRRLEIDLAGHVQRHADQSGLELDAHGLWRIFDDAYLAGDEEPRIALSQVRTDAAAEPRTMFRLRVDGSEHDSEHPGVGPVEALTEALAAHGAPIEILDLQQTSLGAGSDGEALTLIEYRGAHGTGWAAGRDGSVLTATLNAVLTAANASLR